MKRTALSKRLTLAGLALWLALLGGGFLNTTTINDLKTESESVELDSAKLVRVQIEFQVGELKVESGTNSIMDASFRYNDEAFDAAPHTLTLDPQAGVGSVVLVAP